jgi:C-terminal processing protease CtpA/Prc
VRHAVLVIASACASTAPAYQPAPFPLSEHVDDAPPDRKDPDRKRGALPDEAARVAELRFLRERVDAMYAHRAAKLARYKLDEDAVFADAERHLLAATSWVAYDDAIYQALARFHDDHLTYKPPATARPSRGYTPFHLGFDLVQVHDHLLVTRVETGGDVAAAGVVPGDDVIELDGVATTDALARHASHRVYSRAEAATYNYVRTWTRVLVPKGEAPRARSIRVRKRDGGAELPVAIAPRETHEPKPDRVSVARDGDVAIVTIRGVGSTKDARAIDDALVQARTAKAIVIDLRGVNGGEVERVGPHVVGGLAEGTATIATYRVLVAPETLAQRKQWRHLVAGPDGFSAPQQLDVTAQPAGKGFHGALAVVVDAGCASTCEVIAAALRGDLHATVVGETTAGRSGAPVSIQLPSSHGIVKIPSWDLVSADGHPIEDDGVVPDVVVTATPDALAASIDLPLRTAIDHVKKQLARP